MPRQWSIEASVLKYTTSVAAACACGLAVNASAPETHPMLCMPVTPTLAKTAAMLLVSTTGTV